ncbi:condensin complex subunit 2, partial [Corvus kubaryi]|uniref:condensin complex subunit 2 n=1 Tax=Corvus kubaryi TaxID=68294 RepID=UPI001C045371
PPRAAAAAFAASPAPRPLGSTGTPGTPVLAECPNNDDERERRQRRRSRAVDSSLQGLGSPAPRPESWQPPLPQWSNAQIAEHYSTCIKLCSENKITTKNAFGLHLIDYMTEILKQKNSELTNFKVAAGTLDASAKIYAVRVDSVHADTYRVLGNLGKDSAPAKDPQSPEEGSSPAPEAARKAQPRKKQTFRTIEHNLNNINLPEASRGSEVALDLSSSLFSCLSTPLGSGIAQTWEFRLGKGSWNGLGWKRPQSHGKLGGNSHPPERLLLPLAPPGDPRCPLRVPSQDPDSDDDPDPAEFQGEAGEFNLTAHPEAPERTGINGVVNGVINGGDVTTYGELTLIAEPQKINRIAIQYARTAKKMDMRRLKRNMWELLTGAGEEVGGAGEEPDTAAVAGEKVLSDVTKELLHRLPPAMATNLSVPLAFVCLLHLANEKNLKLQSTEDLSDILVQQGD